MGWITSLSSFSSRRDRDYAALKKAAEDRREQQKMAIMGIKNMAINLPGPVYGPTSTGNGTGLSNVGYGGGTGSGGIYPTANTGYYQAQQNYQQAAVNNPQSYFSSPPAPTGYMTTIQFTDAGGLIYAIQIDNAYVNLLTQVSLQHIYLHQTRYQSSGIAIVKTSKYPPDKMLDGDFSEDEMDQAEQIIQEMKHEDAHSCP